MPVLKLIRKLVNGAQEEDSIAKHGRVKLL